MTKIQTDMITSMPVYIHLLLSDQVAENQNWHDHTHAYTNLLAFTFSSTQELKSNGSNFIREKSENFTVQN